MRSPPYHAYIQMRPCGIKIQLATAAATMIKIDFFDQAMHIRYLLLSGAHIYDNTNVDAACCYVLLRVATAKDYAQRLSSAR